MDERQRPTDADLARQAAIQSLISNLVYLAVMIGFTLAITRRDQLTRLAMRIRRRWQPRDPHLGEAMAELRRDIARFEGRQP